MLLAATLAATLAVAGGSRSVRAPAPRCAAAAASETLSRHELRERRRRTRLLAAELSALDVQGSVAVEYAECLTAKGIHSAADICGVDQGVLEACSIHGLDRQRLLAFSRLAALEQTAPAPTSASASSPADGDAGSVGDAGSDPRCEGEGGGDTLELLVPDSLDGSRVDAALAALLPPLSRSYFGGLAADGHVLVGGGRVKKAARVRAGDSLKVWLRAERELSLVPEPLPLEVLLEDEHVVVLNKQAGLVVHPAPGHWSGTLVHGLLHRMLLQRTATPGSAPASPSSDLLPDVSGSGLRPGVVHRLDRFTTGAIVAAKTARAQRQLMAAFAARRVWKVYLAVCVGEPHSRAVIDAPIGRHTTDRLRMAVRRGDGADAREALSVVHRIATDGRLSLVAVLLRTGRTHQIRVHLADAGHPVLGDPLYGDANWNRLEARTARRPLLHARELRLAHPHSGELLHAVAPAPDDLAAYGARLAGVSPDRFDAWAREATDAVLAEARDSFEYC